MRETHGRRQNRILPRGFGADYRTSAAALDHGLRSVPHYHARKQKEVDPGTHPRRLDRAILPRHQDPGGLRPRARRTFGSRTGKGGLRMAQAAKRSKKSAAKPSAAKNEKVKIGIIGGSGLYSMPGLTDTREIRVKTPFGEPSDAVIVGTLEGKRVAFLARHGRGHLFSPSDINYRANICAMKILGVERIISVSAVGSLRDDLPPQDFLIPDQFFDRTRGRVATFFGVGIVAHVGFDKPTCTHLSAHVGEACERAGVKAHRAGTYVCMEGPQFSTLAESQTYRQLRFDVIGMTNLTEAKLAREAEICYATIAMITDYDCWHPQHDAVTVSEIIENLNRNTSNVQRVLHEAVAELPEDRACKCGAALAHAVLTDRKMISPATKKRLAPIIGKYIS